MSYSTKIAYPSPPPTTNSLTSHQRSQLLRSTQKLGRILGTTPALIEESEPMPSMLPLNLQRLAVPLHIQLSSVYSDDDALGGYPSSDTLVSSGSERGSPTSLKRNSSLSSDYSSKSGRSSPFDTPKPAYANESWAKFDRPFLRIAANKRPSKLETIPQSPTGYPPPYSQEPPHNHTSFTIRPIPATQRHAPAPPPAFALPTQTSMRRQKMDKLRRTLGDGVPLDMVFPDEETHPVPMLHSNSSSSSDSEEDFLSHARPHRIRAARDSLLVPHPRSSYQQRVPGAPQAVRAPPPPPALTPRDLKKLSIIAERPEPSPPSPAYRGSTESERYQGDTEGEFAPRHRRGSRLYDGSERRVKRVPVPAA
ncbi:hypothetical protein DFH08DRAFT_1087493 [Mycena albidolilacea]|uniref:Uncharacterized protein n=1 Tax=Mycena albidolilacea TaxID=1033008 RepID=A0AAD6ZAA3_9AGAR|nr:hypothetical protein DFH08DRAFT_1087493 [Mycena albidolilacea]